MLGLVISFALVPDSELYAQNSIEISVMAEVEPTSIELMTLRTMDFTGIDRDQLDVTINPISSDRSGKLVAFGASDSEFRISYMPTRELTNLEGTGAIQFEYTVSGAPLDERENSELLEPESRELLFNEDGEFFFWVGGQIDLSNAEPGTYEGEFTIEIEYP